MDLTIWFLMNLMQTMCGPNIPQEGYGICYDLDGDHDVDLADYAIYQTMYYDCETGYNPDTESMDCGFIEPTYAPQEREKDQMYGK